MQKGQNSMHVLSCLLSSNQINDCKDIRLEKTIPCGAHCCI